jgi:hypothetical protein
MSFRRDYQTADDKNPVKNLPVSRRIDAVVLSGECLDYCDIGVGTDGRDKVRGQRSEEFGARMLMKQRLYKPAFMTQSVIFSTPGYLKKDNSSGRQVRNQKFE